jgi:hypothetical protein
MNSSAHDPDAPVHECGFLLIADMESSTLSKFVLGELEAFKALRTHNRLAINECLTATPVPGVIVNSLGDAIVAKFIATDDSRAALQSCLTAARAIVAAFEQLPALPNKSGPGFRLRSKLLLQHYNAFNYGIRDADDILSDELVGADIDQAFRLAPVAWRLQVLVTDAFMSELMREATLPSGAACDSQALLDRARLARHSGALSPERLRGIEQPLTLNDIHCWVTDAREIARLKGIGQSRRVYALAFERPQALIDRGDQQRLTIKVRQNHHAVILASISLAETVNDNYIEHVVAKLRDGSHGNQLDSEVTLIAAAKVYGEFDFFFRVTCIDDVSLRRFFDAIHADSFGVSHIEVRSTLTDHIAMTRQYARILQRFADRPYELVLTWFEAIPGRDVFEELKVILHADTAGRSAVEILEVGEVIHHTPVYAIFVCESLRDYAAFFPLHGLSPTGCRSHVGHIDRPADAQLRYSLMDGVYMPRGSRNAPISRTRST